MSTPRIFTNNGTWGNSIQWFDYSRRRIYGHHTPVPEKGDFLYYKMTSGKVARFKFKKVERMRDPDDMFFADMVDIGYVDEIGGEMKSKADLWADRLIGILVLPIFPYIMWVDKLSIQETWAGWKAEFWDE